MAQSLPANLPAPLSPTCYDCGAEVEISICQPDDDQPRCESCAATYQAEVDLEGYESSRENAIEHLRDLEVAW